MSVTGIMRVRVSDLLASLVLLLREKRIGLVVCWRCGCEGCVDAALEGDLDWEVDLVVYAATTTIEN